MTDHIEKQYILRGKPAVDLALQEIIDAPIAIAKKEIAYGSYLGSLEQHGDVYAAEQLKLRVNQKLKQVELGEVSLEWAQQQITAEIKRARRHFEGHHQMKYLLANLTVAVLSLMIVPILMRLKTGHWQFFRPEQARRIDQLERSTESLKAHPSESKK